MKITAILLLAACLQVSARGYSQNVSLSMQEASLDKVFLEIKKQTGYTFIYTESILQQANKITVSIRNVSLEKALEAVLKDKGLGYSIVDKTIIIRKKEEPKPTGEQQLPPGIDVSGKVTDNEGNPLQGASVKVKGTTVGTVTDANGVFVLKAVDENAILVFSYAEHETTELKVANRIKLAVALKRMEGNLQEVVINKGYYTEKQKFSVGNVGHIDAKELEKHPIQNPLLALAGNVTGIEITQLTGVPGGGVRVRIQGQNSLSNGLEPLIVVDGVPYPSKFDFTAFEGIVQNGSPLNYINPADIESIDVLKDADATAIYGSRAANGAILITTKRGKAGRTKISINFQEGWGKVTRKVEMMNTRQYLDMRYEAFRNDNLIPTSNPSPPVGSGMLYAPDLTIWDTTRYTDWQRTLIGGTAKYTNVNASLSGGTANAQYLVRSTYSKTTTVFPGDYDDKRGDLHFNFNTNSTSQKLRLQLSGTYMYDNNHLIATDLTQNALFTEPNAPSLYNPDGKLNWAPNGAGTSTWSNPLAYIESQDYRNITKSLVSSLQISYKLMAGLETQINFGYNNLQSSIYSPARLEIYPPEYRANQQRSSSFGSRDVSSWIIEPQAIYKKAIGKGKLESLIGATLQQNDFNILALIASGYSSDLLMKSVQAASSVLVANNVSSTYKYNALFGRLHYNWEDKYLINLTARRDGSSRFGDKNKFHNFGAIGIGWIFSTEKLISNNLPFLSFGKLRASYGTTGNDQIKDYSYLSLYSIIGSIPYQNLLGTGVDRLSNPYLEWEETKKWQGGIDLGFLNDRIIVNATYSLNRSSNQLISYPLPGVTGFNSITQNFPATIQNTSLELMLNTTNIKTKQFSWTSRFNVTIPKNKLASFPNIEKTSFGTSTSATRVGDPLGQIRVYHFSGIDPVTGKYMAFDRNGNPTANPPFADRNVFLNTRVKYYGGLSNSITYKGFQIDFLFQFVYQNGPKQLSYYGSVVPGAFDFSGGGYANQPVTLLDHWRKPGDNAKVARFGTSGSISALLSSDAFYSYDASFIRLKNVSLSWQLPNIWTQKIRSQNVRFYFRGENLATITKYKGLDPETQSLNSLPPLQMWTVGVQADF